MGQTREFVSEGGALGVAKFKGGALGVTKGGAGGAGATPVVVVIDDDVVAGAGGGGGGALGVGIGLPTLTDVGGSQEGENAEGYSSRTTLLVYIGLELSRPLGDLK